MSQDRKRFLQQVGSGLLLAGLPAASFAQDLGTEEFDPRDFDAEGAPDDEKYWKQIARKYYSVSPEYTNLENGYYGLQSKPVLQAYLKNINHANYESGRFARKIYPDTLTAVKKELAAFLSVSSDEIIITRNATEALNIAIQGYPFKQGDEVIINQLDYFSMIEAFRMLEKRGKIKVNAFGMPLNPANEDEIVEIYRKIITEKTKVILLTHVSNINGLIVPVAKIAAMAKQKNIDVICDSAHALGQLNYSLPGLGVDFVGMNLHKWIGNPIGAGVLYVKKERVKEMSSLFGDVNAPEDSINKLSHFGTTPFPVIMTIPESIAFHKLMNVDRISNRLHYLKTVWVNHMKDHPKVEVVTPVDKTLSCAIASFRIKDMKTSDVADQLFKTWNILTTTRSLGSEGCIRVTPSVYTSINDLNKFIKAVDGIAGIQ